MHVSAILSVVSSLLVGIVLATAPWTSLWDSNWLLQPWPELRPLLLSGFARGSVTGLGLINVLVAIADLHARLFGPRRG